MHRFLSVRLYQKCTRKNHISKSIVPRVMKLGVEIDLDDLSSDLEGQGHGSKVKVNRSRNVIFGTRKKSYLKKYSA